MLKMFAVWVINALALLALPYVFSSIHVSSFGTALLVALVLGLINTLLRPLLILLTLPVTLLTLGLFVLVMIAIMIAVGLSTVRIEPDGLRIRNGVRSHWITWSEVRGIRFSPHDAWAFVQLDGDPDTRTKPTSRTEITSCDRSRTSTPSRRMQVGSAQSNVPA